MFVVFLVVSFCKIVFCSGDWPTCVLQDRVPRTSHPIFADVRGFINHPEDVQHKSFTFTSSRPIGMALRETPHEFGEIVEDVVRDSQAWVVGVRKGWIITAVNGRRFSTSERLKDLGTDFERAKAAGPSVVVKYDVRTAVDCTDANCRNSDRFPARSVKHCAISCSRITGCEWWSYGIDQMCKLLGGVDGFVDSLASSTGISSCVPLPVFSRSASWPTCITQDADLHFGTPLFTDVRGLIRHPDDVRHREIIFTSDGNVGMGLREQPHDLGELVSDVIVGSQAHNAGVQKGWIIKEVAGKPFTKSSALLDVVSDFKSAKAAGPTLTVKFDVRSSIDCTDGNCARSDKFPAASKEVCAATCAQTDRCASWSFAEEAGDDMCWLRADQGKLRAQWASVVGSKSCQPPAQGSNSLLLLMLFALAFVCFREKLTNLIQSLGRFRGPLKTSPDSYAQMLVELVSVGHKQMLYAENRFSDELYPLTSSKSCQNSGVQSSPCSRPWYTTLMAGFGSSTSSNSSRPASSSESGVEL